MYITRHYIVCFYIPFPSKDISACDYTLFISSTDICQDVIADKAISLNKTLHQQGFQNLI